MSFAGPRRGSGQHIDTVKKFLVSFGFCFAIGLAAWGAFRVDVPNTEPFRVAEKFLVSNSKVVAAVGPVESIRLPVFNEWEISYVGESEGAAFFSMDIVGSKGHLPADVSLVRKAGTWMVTNATIGTGNEVIKLTLGELLHGFPLNAGAPRVCAPVS